MIPYQTPKEFDMWRSTWTYSHTQLNLYRLCPRRYYERYILPPPEEALKESLSLSQEYSKYVIHPGIEHFHNSNSKFSLDLSIEKFLSVPGVSREECEWARPLALSILASYALNPIKGQVTHVERDGKLFLDDIVDGTPKKWQFISKPDLVVENPDAVTDIKFTTSTRPYPLKPFDDQMLGQAIVWEKPMFRRYQICVDAKTMTLKDIVVEEHGVDPLLRDNWFERTIKTMRDIEESRRTNLWTEHDHACGAFNRQCPYYGSCVYGRVR